MLSRNNYTPDVLDCLANLSNDEVFTPPIIVNQMLDMLPQEVFKSRQTTFLDPFTKSGVFLREITKRLLANQVPNYKQTATEIEYVTKEAIQNAVRTGELDLNDADYERKARAIGDEAIKNHPEANTYLTFEVDLQNALDHILRNQVFGIAITELTAQLARRSLYCSKDASGRYSIVGTEFGDNADGNIRFKPMKHVWDKANLNGTAKQGASCKYCGASAATMDRPNDFETHAYEFIHIEKPEEIWNMEFTVVIGNPPYQLADGGGGAGKSATPIYQHFVTQAKRLKPKFLSMIIPSRWFNGGKGLDDFRKQMLNDDRMATIVDFADSKDCFPSGVDIPGGICYFLWDSKHHGTCSVTNVLKDGTRSTEQRILNEFDTFVRQNRAVDIVKKAKVYEESMMSEIVSSRKPFGLESKQQFDDDGDVILRNSTGLGKVKKARLLSGLELVDKWKVIVSKVSYEHAGVPDKDGKMRVLSVVQKLEPNSACTESYLVVGAFDNESEADNMISYLKTKFSRFLIMQMLASMNMSKSSYSFLPVQDWGQSWNDQILYEKYGLSQDEIDFIESIIIPYE